MKPSWENAPEWANYLAMDRDREWYWFELRPTRGKGVWEAEGMLAFAGWECWDETLEFRPSVKDEG